MENNWKESTLADFIDIMHGYAFKGEFFSDSETKNILLTPGNFRIGGGFKREKFKYYKDNVEFPEDYILKYEDILITMTDLSKGGDTLGYPLIVPHSDNSIYLHNQRLGKIIFLNEKIDRLFLYYLMCTREYREEVLAGATGTTVKHTAPKRILKFKFMLPPMKEQKKISQVLWNLDNRIELNNEMNKTLEEMAQAIFKSWFVDFEPFKDGEFEESELGMIPKGYEVGYVSDLCDVSSSKRIFMADYREEGVPFYRGKEIIEKAKGKDVSTEIYIDNIKFNEIKEKFGIPQKGDILLTSVGTIGIPYLVKNEEFYFKDGNLTWFKDFKLDGYNLYLYYWIKFGEGKNNIDKVTIGSTQKALTISALKGMKIVIPNYEYVRKFYKYMEAIVQRYEKNIAESNTLKNIRDILLPKLISGEIQI